MSKLYTVTEIDFEDGELSNVAPWNVVFSSLEAAKAEIQSTHNEYHLAFGEGAPQAIEWEDMPDGVGSKSLILDADGSQWIVQQVYVREG